MGDRGYCAAPAISPNGTDVWLVYNAFTTPFREITGEDRQLVGVVLHADVTDGTVGDLTEVHRGESGDARGSGQNNLAARRTSNGSTASSPSPRTRRLRPT